MAISFTIIASQSKAVAEHFMKKKEETTCWIFVEKSTGSSLTRN